MGVEILIGDQEGLIELVKSEPRVTNRRYDIMEMPDGRVNPADILSAEALGQENGQSRQNQDIWSGWSRVSGQRAQVRDVWDWGHLCGNSGSVA